MSYLSGTSFKDSPNLDAFGRLRVSSPVLAHEGQFTYNLLTLRFEQIASGTGASIAHDAQNRAALMTFSSSGVAAAAYMQTYEYFLYQPGRSQLGFITFNMRGGVAGATKFAGMSDGINGIEFQVANSVNQFMIYSGTGLGNQTVIQDNWNLDKLDGTGPSGITLDNTKVQILVIDFQALYTGRVRVGFDIGGVIIYVHEFNHSNTVFFPYLQYATLPIRCGMTVQSGSVSTTMLFICSSVISEGGTLETEGVSNTFTSSITAASGADTHVLSVRPKTTFGGVTNRTNMLLYTVSGVVTGNFPVLYKLVVGQAITGASYADVGTFSAFEGTAVGTVSGSPAHVVESDFIAATNTTKSSTQNKSMHRLPITLNAAGAIRANGTLTILAQGIGGVSTCNFSINWRELR